MIIGAQIQKGLEAYTLEVQGLWIKWYTRTYSNVQSPESKLKPNAEDLV